MTPGKQPHAGIDQRHGGDFAAGQHIIADRDLFQARARRSRARRRPRSGRRPAHAGAFARAPRRGSASAAFRAATAEPGARIGRSAVASMARPSTSAFITMPGPPPAGVSSTERCLSVAKLRISTDVERPGSGRQRLAGKAYAERSRKHVGKNGENAGAPHVSVRSRYLTPRRSSLVACRRERIDDDASAGKIDHRHGDSIERQAVRSLPPPSGRTSIRSPAPKLCTAIDGAAPLAGAIDARQARPDRRDRIRRARRAAGSRSRGT